MKRDQVIRWRCPACKHDHKWIWETHDPDEGRIGMLCDKCSVETQMWMGKVGPKRWAATAQAIARRAAA